jgi:NAD(P)-dependent dehydrogenase (short-subunit alcohol dehydrogenase family)
MTGSERLAIVTGTSSGIGAATVHELIRRGWTVIGVARRAGPLDHPNYRHLVADLSDTAALESGLGAILVRELARGWQRVGLVNNAADSDPLGSFESVSPLEVRRAHAVNLVAPIWLMGLVTRSAPAGAAVRIVNVSSGAAANAFPGLGAYCAAKAGLRMAGQVMAVELDSALRPGGARPDATIFSYEPGIVDTAMQTTARERSPAAFPWVGMFTGFVRDKMLVPPTGPAREIVDYLESPKAPRFTERRFAG